MVLEGFAGLAFDPEKAAAVADSYAQIAGWLAGIAAAGLIVYLTRQTADDDDQDDQERQGQDSQGQSQGQGQTTADGDAAPAAPARKPIGSRHVVRSLFFAMSALAICAFLYASAIDDATSPGRLAVEMMFYGAALGTAVLALFYALSIMMLEHRVTRAAAVSSYWMIAVVGPAVVLRFTTAAAYEGWRMSHPAETSWLSPLPLGIAYAVLLALGLLWVVSYDMPTRPLRQLRDKLRARPVAPAVAAFHFAAACGVLSVLTTPAAAGYLPHPALSWAAVIASSVAVTYFAFACVSVLGERIGGRRSLPAWSDRPLLPRRRRKTPPTGMVAAGRS